MSEDVTDKPSQSSTEVKGFIESVITEIFTSPLNIFLLAICFVLLYKIYKSSRTSVPAPIPPVPSIPKLKRQDMYLEQLQKYDGTDEHGRVCVAVNGKIFDVTKGKKFYGPGGPYSAFAGHDATRALATFSVNNVKETCDDLSDLTSMEMESVREWEIQFNERYEYVGKLLKPGEEPTEYSDDEDSTNSVSSKDKDKDTATKKED